MQQFYDLKSKYGGQLSFRYSCNIDLSGGKRETGDPSVTSAAEAVEEMAGSQGSKGTIHVHFRKRENFLFFIIFTCIYF